MVDGNAEHRCVPLWPLHPARSAGRGNQRAAMMQKRGSVPFFPETGTLEPMAPDLGGWAGAILNDYQLLTGHPLAREWQSLHGPIPLGKRLLPKLPFVLGGEYSVSNLYLQDAVEGMRVRGHLAVAIKDVPDGGKIKIEIAK